LRKYFIKSKYEWALWLDSDIIPPPELPKILYEIAIKENALCVVNAYPGRNGKYWHGAGCMLTHKDVCKVSKFGIPYFSSTGKHLSEDAYFLSILRGLNAFSQWIGKKVIVEGKFVEVKHIIGGGQG